MNVPILMGVFGDYKGVSQYVHQNVIVVYV